MKLNFGWTLTTLIFSMLLVLASITLAQEGTWTTGADMPLALGGTCSAVVNGKIYVFGGAAQGIIMQRAVLEFDPVADSWTRKADMPTPRTLGFASVEGYDTGIHPFVPTGVSPQGKLPVCWAEMK